ncbi:oxidoreductase, FAD-binding [Oceanicola granulosus HTCC2516]|uniref:Oxidoreductase, FAD-binding n=1 Tax=Oceanicola granulosus (strain ATCC BAA-861 / DSM 15982 / KCTC 12143 / HTCC2516) TaxID=314256 RepID=Q2CCT6_OCEGH|nr:FAD-dependent oxidoreductase [Oceanicola granulosus]EAR50537.1 oxidoreductase, FAD-binding [Oceanicola granulosus HTCC2516]
MATPDVTVKGAGVFGLAVAYACARRGARVRVIDPAGPAAGASGGIVGALAPHVPEHWNDKKAFQLESLLMGEDWWGGVAGLSGEDPGYARSGRLQPLADDAAVALAKTRATGAAALWQGAARWEVVAGDGGWGVASPTGLFVHDTLSGRLFPRRATRALAAAVAMLGGEVVAEGAEAGAVVWATGWRGLAEVGGAGVKGQAARLALALPARRPQLFADGLHVIPHADGTVAIGSTSERDFAAPDTTDDRLDALVARARALVPALAGAPVVERWAGVRPRARSRAPLLGPHPARAGQFIANGGFKIGFGMAPLAGEAMADLVLEGRDGRIPAGFRP